MAKREGAPHPSARLLVEALDAGRFTRVDVMRALGLGSRQNVTNWLSHGVPARHIPGVARLCGMSTDEYRARSGITDSSPDTLTLPATPEVAELVDAFSPLPPGLQRYIVRRLQEVKGHFERASALARRSLTDPADDQGELLIDLFSDMKARADVTDKTAGQLPLIDETDVQI